MSKLIKFDLYSYAINFLAIVAIIWGVIRIESKTLRQKNMFDYPGIISFAIGWLLFIWNNREYGWMLYLSALFVMVGAMMGQTAYTNSTKMKGVSTVGVVLFFVGWIGLSWSLGQDPKNDEVVLNKLLIAVTGAIGILSAMLYVLPRQRKTGDIYGLGIPIFTLGWTLIAFAASYT